MYAHCCEFWTAEASNDSTSVLITAPLKLINTCRVICSVITPSRAWQLKDSGVLFLNIVRMLCTPTHTLVHAHTHTHTLLIIIGWDAWGMCPSKQKHTTASLAETDCLSLLIRPRSWYSLPLLLPGVYAFPSSPWEDETKATPFLIVRGCRCVWMRHMLRGHCWLRQTSC